MKKHFRSLARGGYLAGATALAVALVVALNLMVGQLPSSVTEKDLTDNSLYEITDTSRDFLSSLDKDVEIVVLAEEGSMDGRITKFLELYEALSDHLTVTYIDPVASPAAAAEYQSESGSLVVTCEDTGRSRTLTQNDLIVYEMDYNYWYSYESAFDAEGQLTSAVSYVTSESTQTVYTLTGHGESALPTALSEDLEKANLTVSDLSLLMEGAVPEDASLVLVNAPTSDLAAEEVTLLEDYVTGGGHLLLLVDQDKGALPNLEGLMERAGLTMASGYIADPQRCYRSLQGQDSYYSLAPNFTMGSLSDSLSADSQFMILNSRGFTQLETLPDDVTIEEVLTTSEEAYAVTQTEQVQGQYLLGAIATLGDNEGTMTVFSAALVNEAVLTYYPSMGNEQLFINTVTAHMDQTSTFSIPSKSLEETYNTITLAGPLSFLFVLVLPVGTLIIGLVIWMRRRRR